MFHTSGWLSMSIIGYGICFKNGRMHGRFRHVDYRRNKNTYIYIVYILYIFSIYLKHLMYMKYLEVLFICKKSPFWNLKEELFSWVTFPFEPAHVFSCLKLHCNLLWNEMYTEYVQDFGHYYFPNLSFFIHV